MPAYFSLGAKNSDSSSGRYLKINNCGFCEDMEKTVVSRPQGRKDYQLIYVRSGQMAFQTPHGTQLLTDGDVYLYRPGMPQYYSVNGIKTTFYWIHFTGKAVPEILDGIPDGLIRSGVFPPFENFCKTMYMTFHSCPPPNLLRFEGELICLISQVAQKASGDAQPPLDSKIQPALLAINRNIHCRLSNEALAQLCNLNKFYFIKLFKQTTGQTPQQYYTRQAIETARDLLENTDDTVAQIAILCGIEDCFYFSRMFKKHTGLSPTDYRKNIRHGKGGQTTKNVL